MRILVVEDEPALRDQLERELKSQDYTVDATGDGKEALYFATDYPFDAAIVDLGLPGLSGLELITQLRAKGSRLPVLILTARGRWQDKVEGLEAGADDYLTKPFQTEELLARLKALLRRAAGASAESSACGPVTLNLSCAAGEREWSADRAHVLRVPAARAACPQPRARAVQGRARRTLVSARRRARQQRDRSADRPAAAQARPRRIAAAAGDAAWTGVSVHAWDG